MKTTLVQHGDKKALIIEEALLKQLNIDLETPLDLNAEGDALVITPVRDEIDPEFQDMMERINKRYGRAFKRLAE